MDEPKWEWWASCDDERFTEGPFSTREEAIWSGRELVDEDEHFWITEAVQGSRADLLPSGTQLIERIIEDFLNGDLSSEHDDGELCGTADEKDAAIAALDLALKAWFAEHGHVLPQPSLFRRSRNAECLPHSAALEQKP